MNVKYLGEAVVLLGIAWSIMRWVARNAADADAGPSDAGMDPPPEGGASPSDSGETWHRSDGSSSD